MSELAWVLPTNLLPISIRVMQPYGARGEEGLALWFGRREHDVAIVTHVVEAFGSGFSTSPLHLRLSRRAMAALGDLAISLDCYLVGQIHSHPFRLLDLSDLDRTQGIRVSDYLSVVCPHYAQRTNTRFEDCGVHAFEDDDYRRLSSAEQLARIRFTEEPALLVKQEVFHD